MDMSYNNRFESKINVGVIIGVVSIFLLLPPFIGIPIIISFLATKTNATKTQYYTYFACIAAYIGAVNATKSPGGDQIQYYVAYMNVPDVGFWKSLVHIYGLGYFKDPTKVTISGEFMNGIYNYLGYYLTLGYYPLFIAIYSFSEIMLVLMGVYHFSTKLKKPHKPLICGVIVLCFFYLYFNLMLQIQKQFFGQAIMMYVLGYYARYGKMTTKLYILVAISVFTHAANLLFIPFLLIKKLRGNLSKQALMFMSMMFVTLIILGPRIAGSLSVENGGVLSYGVSRLADSDGLADNAGSLTFLHPRTLIILLPLLYVLYKKLWRERKALNSTEMFILNIQLLLILAVFAMFNQPLAQYRYFMMTYFFVPFFLPYISSQVQKRDNILVLIVGLSLSTFYVFFEHIIWQYAPVFDIIIKSPILLVFGDYYKI